MQSTLWKLLPQMFLKVPPQFVVALGLGLWGPGAQAHSSSAKHLCLGTNFSSRYCYRHGVNELNLSCQAPKATQKLGGGCV